MSPAGSGAAAPAGTGGTAAVAASGRRILLGVCGGVAAYKAAELVRRLRERGHEVRCAVTPTAARFVSPLTLEVLSAHPVYGEEYLEPGRQGKEEHISAAAWAELLLHRAGDRAHALQPRSGAGAQLPLDPGARLSAARSSLAPAMHSAMWEKPALQENMRARCGVRGVRIVGPVSGPARLG